MKRFPVFAILAIAVLVQGQPSNPADGSFHLEAVDNGYIFEGDMVMTKEEISTAIHGGDISKVESVYGLQKSSYYKWPGAKVPYVFDKSLNTLLGVTKGALKRAMAAWEAKTCIRFVPHTNERDYILFFNGGFGKCYSQVGRVGGQQKLSLGFGCFTTGIAIHEIGHALGLHHEQSRPDRDDYVEIVWSNIPKDKQHNFRKYSRGNIDSLGSPYDYDSIMHYGARDFARIPFTKTIKVKKSGVSIGQRKYISKEDAVQINRYYKCPNA